VIFYSDDRQLLEEVSQFTGAALKAGNAAVLVATKSHRDSLLQALQTFGVDILARVEQGRYISLDAADTLSTFMVDEMLEPVRFLESFSQLILKAATAAEWEHPRVAVFGKGGDILWKQGRTEAPIEDEKLCNQLCGRYHVDILCGYSLSNIQGLVDEKVFERICAEHSAVCLP
jgi:hypothetical protein